MVAFCEWLEQLQREYYEDFEDPIWSWDFNQKEQSEILSWMDRREVEGALKMAHNKLKKLMNCVDFSTFMKVAIENEAELEAPRDLSFKLKLWREIADHFPRGRDERKDGLWTMENDMNEAIEKLEEWRRAWDPESWDCEMHIAK